MTRRVKMLDAVTIRGTVIEVDDEKAMIEVTDEDGRGVAFLTLSHEALAQRLEVVRGEGRAAR